MFIILGLVLMLSGLFMNSVLGYDQVDTLSDEEMVMEYMTETYGYDNDYEVEVIESDSTEYIHYHYTVNGKYCGINSIERE